MNSKSIDSTRFDAIMDKDNIELFNRDYLDDSTNQRWMQFMEHKRRQHYESRRRCTRGITWTFISCFAIAMLFLMLAMNGNEVELEYEDDNDFQWERNKLEESSVTYIEQCMAIPPNSRIDCNPDPPISAEVCQSRGCCWMPSSNESSENMNLLKKNVLPPLNVPYCFFGSDYHGYNVSNVQTINDNQKVINLQRIRDSGFVNDVKNVRIQIDELSSNVLRIKMIDSDSSRYEVPIPVLNLPKRNEVLESLNEKMYQVEMNSTDFMLTVYRAKTKAIVFNVNLGQLIYSNQFIQITNKLASNFIFGIGENRESFRKLTNWKRYTLFARDQWPVPDRALYGSHPFYLATESDNSSHGVFLFNSNAMDIITQPMPAITYRTIGGILDFFLFLGPTSENVIEQYHQLIGLPTMPAYWTLGFHLSRYGYRNLSNLEKTFRRTRKAEIPFDVQWTDIDMFDSNNDFTYDRKRFDGLPKFIEHLHSINMRFVPMFDCGISSGEHPPQSYLPYKMGLEMNVFVRNGTNQPFEGKVWNSKSTVWPDFTHPNATKYWTRQFAEYHKTIQFDGAWIDMNEPSNFLDGAFNGCPTNSTLETPQYTPGMVEDSLTLNHKTLCMSARHSIGLHYNLHNLYGISEAIVTKSALESVLKRRSFILSRSTAPGHGHFAAHWDGDILSDWPSMKWSISSILNFNIFGVPLIGADICGFNGNTTIELCARWHQLGAFYTFVRNHNTDNAIDQDPVALGPLVVKAAKNALKLRYALLPYLYTQFYRVHRKGGTILRPLFFEFVHDQVVLEIETQFMWGSSIMVAPALSINETETSVYFPSGTWFHSYNFTRINTIGKFLPQLASFDYPNVYFRAGSIIPTLRPMLTTDETHSGNFTLLVALSNENGHAEGDLYLDSGDGLDTEVLGHYNLYSFKVEKKILEIKSSHLGYSTEQMIDNVLILGIDKSPIEIKINGRSMKSWSYSKNKIHINSLNLPLYDLKTIDKSKLIQIHYQIEWV
ncbi:hypothetical protein BLOT_012805 [Blomia tropicalis]|nr:hypothetical protein BLOT_012805 [Blomia tropicalis]